MIQLNKSSLTMNLMINKVTIKNFLDHSCKLINLNYLKLDLYKNPFYIIYNLLD